MVRSLRVKSQAHGFTLVELMIVVAIVGVLATIAVVSYQRIIASSHTSEATQMINSIKIAQEAYHAEVGTYVNVSSGPDDFCPVHAAGAPTKVPWNSACGSGPNGPWSTLPVNSNGPVLFGYSTTSGLAGGGMTFPAGMASTPVSPTTLAADWYVVSAQGDMNGNGVPCTVVGTSLSRDLYLDREGE